MADVVVVGGGAAGMAAAASAARQGARVLVLERMDRVGKKLLATGNGRCNLMNVGAWRYPGGAGFAHSVLSRCGAREQERFWQELGLRLKAEEGGRVYPVSGQASTVLDTLRLAMDHLGVEVVTGVSVDGLSATRHGFSVTAGEQAWSGRRVVVAGGGCAQPKLGSDGSTWRIMTALGYRLVQPRPALVQMITDVAPIRGLSGIRAQCTLRVEGQGRTLHEETGEALFTDYGVSGVCAMQCARYAAAGGTLHLDLLAGMGLRDEQEAREELLRRKDAWREQPLECLLTGLCVPRLASALCQKAGIRWKDRRIGSLTKEEALSLAKTMKDFSLSIKGVKGFEAAQVTAGGLAVDSFDPTTLESRLHPGLYAAGEILDVDGDCGGFNLMFAFGSGIIAGEAAASSLYRR